MEPTAISCPWCGFTIDKGEDSTHRSSTLFPTFTARVHTPCAREMDDAEYGSPPHGADR